MQERQPHDQRWPPRDNLNNFSLLLITSRFSVKSEIQKLCLPAKERGWNTHIDNKDSYWVNPASWYSLGFPEIVRMGGAGKMVCHWSKHHLAITIRLSVTLELRRITLDLKIRCQNLVTNTSNSPRAVPLHIVLLVEHKESNELIPCRDHRSFSRICTAHLNSPSSEPGNSK